MSDALFRNNVQHFREELQDLADLIVLDEAHIMLKNKTNAVFKALMGVKTLRRICLTGSPFQNNLFEYFRMASYIRPGVLGKSEKSFEKEYVIPIQEGVSTDATEEAKLRADECMDEIQRILDPFVHRKGPSVLLEELPPMQQGKFQMMSLGKLLFSFLLAIAILRLVVLHTRQTKLQRRLGGIYKQSQKSSDRDVNNFLHMYATLRPIYNHPGTLLFRETKAPLKEKKVEDSLRLLNEANTMTPSANFDNETPTIVIKTEPIESGSVPQPVETAEKKDPDDISIIELLSDSEEEELEKEFESEIEETPQVWWSSVEKKINKDEMKNIENGNKVVLLLHILTHACQLNEKVVLFSQCLKVCVFQSGICFMNCTPHNLSFLSFRHWTTLLLFLQSKIGLVKFLP